MYLQAENTLLGEKPYWVFVSFLYAWIAADLAKDFAETSRDWLDRKKEGVVHPIMSHLVLVSFVVGTSWLGWSGSFVRGEIPAFDKPVGVEVIASTSLLLIVDFWILAMYFGFSKVVHAARLSGEYKQWSSHAGYWVAWISVAYVVWDFMVYYVVPRWTGFGDGNHLCEHWWMSVLCAGIAIAVFFMFKRGIPSDHPLRLVASDISLLGLVLFYRTLKQLAEPGQPGWLYGFRSGFLLLFVVAGLLALIPWPARPKPQAGVAP
jgi:hypothetical protein